MGTIKLNSANFEALRTSAKGVLLVYTASNGTQSAQHFFGDGYEAKSKKSDDIFKAWKNIVKTFWAVKVKELELREDNDGIRTKLRATIPSEVRFNCDNGDSVSFNLDSNVWARIGLIPTNKDLERIKNSNDRKAAVHRATQASFTALGFRLVLENEDEKPEKKEKKEKTKVVAQGKEKELLDKVAAEVAADKQAEEQPLEKVA